MYKPSQETDGYWQASTPPNSLLADNLSVVTAPHTPLGAAAFPLHTPCKLFAI